MWRNYWTVAVRALAKSKTYSIINIAGLAIGMAACIMILLYVRYERSYDAWIPDVENTYQLQTWIPHPKDGQISQRVGADHVEAALAAVSELGYSGHRADHHVGTGEHESVIGESDAGSRAVATICSYREARDARQHRRGHL